MRPNNQSAHRSSRGFTLLEVLVALVIVALGMSALLEMLSQSASNISALRDKTVAEWIAMNQIALARLSLNAPTAGTTQGDVQACANGNWHWQQQIAAVDAVPGLLSITVSVQRTGDATAAQIQNAAPATGGASSPGATGSLGPNVTLGPTAALGSVSTLSSSGCANTVAPGGSLGSGSSPGLGNSPASLGPSSLGSKSSPFGSSSTSLGSGGSTAVANSVTSSLNNATSAASSSSSSDKGGWLVTITGFRGNSLGSASGESPDWTGTAISNGSATGTTTNTITGSVSAAQGTTP